MMVQNVLTGGFVMGASVSAGLWAYDGNPVALGVAVFLSFCALALLLERHSNVAGIRSAAAAAALLRSEGRASAKVLNAAGTLADTLVAQDQITAETLETADREVTRNVRSKAEE